MVRPLSSIETYCTVSAFRVPYGTVQYMPRAAKGVYERLRKGQLLVNALAHKKNGSRLQKFFRLAAATPLPTPWRLRTPALFFPRRSHAPLGNGLRQPRQRFFSRYERPRLLWLSFFLASGTPQQIRTARIPPAGRGGGAREWAHRNRGRTLPRRASAAEAGSPNILFVYEQGPSSHLICC